jgi:hypothetical protein
LFLLLLPMLIVGGLAMLHVASCARLSDLECECRRLERLDLEQKMRRGELMRERDKLIHAAVVSDYGPKHNMVNPVGAKPIRVGVLPARKIYWDLPGEEAPASPPGASAAGQAPPGSASSAGKR